MSSALEARQNRMKWKVKKHLEYLGNNYKVAEHVAKTLERGEFEEAAMLVRQASKSQSVTVAWNHLIDYQMQQQRLHAAVKLYNEMKKRNQLPNAQSYTILFRGFANSVHPKLAVSEAVRIYHTMLTSPRLQPNTIHMNAVLGACARAEDIESMFSIVSTADDKLRTPNSRTYTLILNALRPKNSPARVHRRREIPENEEDAEAQQAADVGAINQGKAIWEEVIRRWRKAQLVIDEPLVCAMGRLLGSGGRKENEEVLALVEQTMKIPKMAEVDASDFLPSPKGSPPAEQTAQLAAETTEAVAKFQAQTRIKIANRNYAHAGNNTLSMILESLAVTRKTTLGPKYWDFLVNKCHVTPDNATYHQYLRLLRVGRASATAADLIESIPVEHLAPKTFRLGLSTCIKDNLNPNAFVNATRIFRTMSKLRVPDAHSMRLYLQATRANYRQFRDKPDGKFQLGKQIAMALDNMWEPFGQLSRSFSFSRSEAKSPEEEWMATLNDRMEATAVARRMVAAMDFIVTEGAGTPEVIKLLTTRRNILNRQVTRFFEKHQEMEARMPSKQQSIAQQRMREVFSAGEAKDDGLDELGEHDKIITAKKHWQ
jgi:pentatricopeptide repeat protein